MELNDELDGLAVEIGQRLPPPSVLERRAIVVTGSHRSGTSALARVLSLVGCDLPKHVMPPLAGSNELGFWEPELVVQAHEAFLAKIGSSWDDAGPLPDGVFVSAHAVELRRQLSLLLQDEYGTSPLFVVKDPRISRLLPVWFAVLEELQVAPVTAIAVRNPLEVAASLKTRDGFTTTKSLMLWLRHALDAEQHSRDRPRSIFMYDALLRDWQGTLAKLGADLDIKWPLNSHRASVEIENFLSEQHRHHVFNWNDLEGRADVVSWVKETYFALRSSNPVPILDQIRDDLSRADAAFGPIIEEVRLAARMSDEKLLEAAAERDMLAAELDERSATLEARAAEVQQLQEEAAGLANAVAAYDERAAAHREEIGTVRAVRDAFASEVGVLAAEVERLAATVKEAQSRAAAVEPELESAREKLQEASTDVERLTAQANESASRIAALEAERTAERATLLSALEAARAEAEQLEQEAAAANAGLAALEARAAAERGKLLEQLDAARADVERLTARVSAAELEATAHRRRMLSELDSAMAEGLQLAEQLEVKSHDAEELASAADELLSTAIAEIEVFRADRDRLQSEVVDGLEEQGQLLILIEHLEAALERTSSALSDREGAEAAVAAEFVARRAEWDAEGSKMLTDLEAARTEVETARPEVALVRNEFEKLKSDAARERATLIAERDAGRAEDERLLAELEAARTHSERLAADTAELEAALDQQRALLDALRSVTKRRNPRRRSLSQLGTWLLPPTPRKLNYLMRYLFLRWSREFDVDAYLLANPDVLVAGVNPLMHYVQYGRSEGRQPFGGDQQHRSSSSREMEPPTPAIEENSALDEAIAPDAASPLTADPDLDHVEEARSEEAPSPEDTEAVASSDATLDLSDDDLRKALEAEFDPEYYYGAHDDIEKSGMDPLEHYFYTGWREGRDPSAHFSTSYYLSSNPDVAAEELNPLVHYVLTGRREGRRPFPTTGFKRQTLARLRPLDEEIAHWQHGLAAASTPLDGASLADRLVTCIGTRRHVVLSCSHDNYTKIVGGVQLCVALEQAAFAKRDCAYINLHPVRPLPVLSPETEPEALSLTVLCDGQEVGTATAAAVIAALAGVACDHGVDFGLVVHALHGHSPEVVAELHSRLGPRWAWLWLHDYFGICPGATLLRNRIEPCGAPQPESPGCTICIFGEERLRHLPRFHTLLDRVPFKLVAPSQFMVDRWKLYFGRDELDISVHEIGTLSGVPHAAERAGPPAATREGPARVAFLGAPAVHKGWDVFLELVRRSAAGGNYRFYHFGDGRYRAPDVERREVSVTQNEPLAAVDALRAEAIDVAVLWSLWEESFSYTAHEALSAGAAIVTNQSSGNIARVVRTSGEGLVFSDEDELFAAFESESILNLVHARRTRRPARADFAHSRMTADFANFDA